MIGCVLDVSGTMKTSLEAGNVDNVETNERTTERLRAVLGATLKAVQAEQMLNRTSLIFVGVFGLNTEHGGPASVDLCSVASELLGFASEQQQEQRSGHDRLVARANRQNMDHIERYIRENLTDHEARIVDAHLEAQTNKVQQFVDAIPSKKAVIVVDSVLDAVLGPVPSPVPGPVLGQGLGSATNTDSVIVRPAAGPVPITRFFSPITAIVTAPILKAARNTTEWAKDKAVERSKALALARQICAEWLDQFSEFVPRHIEEVIDLLERLLDHHDHRAGGPAGGDHDSSELDTLKRYMYGNTPMHAVLTRSLGVFHARANYERRVLLVVTDGKSTDGDPEPVARDLAAKGVDMAAVYLTSDDDDNRQLYYLPQNRWNDGQQALFRMARTVSALQHPVPVLASLGWQIPSAGEFRLFAIVSTAAALDEFCSHLLSAAQSPSGGNQALYWEIVSRVRLDESVGKAYVGIYSNPSNQGTAPTCYAHATAAVVHLALLRIVGRRGGHPAMQEIRERIEAAFPPPAEDVRDMAVVLREATRWYPPLQFCEINEDAARQAVLRRRPVLASFVLSQPGWQTFCEHFEARELPQPRPVLTCAQMVPHCQSNPGDGHAVIMISCDPHSLTFLNSWGPVWGNSGSFSIENHTVLELEASASENGQSRPMKFYDVYWVENDLRPEERQAYVDYRGDAPF